MRTLFGLVLGCVVGAALGLAALYYSPLGAINERSGNWQETWRSGDESAMLVTHSERIPVALQPYGTQSLWENAIAATAMTAYDVAAGDRRLFVSRLSLPLENSQLLFGQATFESAWLVSEPGVGSFWLSQEENHWDLMKRRLLPAWLLDEEFSGSETYPSTVPGSGRVLGATGGFAARAGSAAERLHLGRVGGVALGLQSEIGLSWEEPAVATQQSAPEAE